MHWSEDKICFSNNILTSQGPGTAIPFALEVLEMLVTSHKAREIADQMVF